MRKLFAFDIDGTLIDHKNRKIPKKSMSALIELKRQGHIVGIATGRNRTQLCKVIDESMFDFLILNNGGYAEINSVNILKHPFNDSDITQILELLDQNNCEYIITDENQLYTQQPESKGVKRIIKMFDLITPVKEENLRSKSIYQVIVCENVVIGKELFGLLENYRFNRFDSVFGFDVNQRDVTKGTALIEVIKYFNVDLKNVYGFGDADNDIDFIAKAGTGIAMGNSVQELKDVADYVTNSVDKDGIYNALKHFKFLE